jgi:hypothetical protein
VTGVVRAKDGRYLLWDLLLAVNVGIVAVFLVGHFLLRIGSSQGHDVPG